MRVPESFVQNASLLLGVSCALFLSGCGNNSLAKRQIVCQEGSRVDDIAMLHQVCVPTDRADRNLVKEWAKLIGDAKSTTTPSLGVVAFSKFVPVLSTLDTINASDIRVQQVHVIDPETKEGSSLVLSDDEALSPAQRIVKALEQRRDESRDVLGQHMFERLLRAFSDEKLALRGFYGVGLPSELSAFWESNPDFVRVIRMQPVDQQVLWPLPLPDRPLANFRIKYWWD